MTDTEIERHHTGEQVLIFEVSDDDAGGCGGHAGENRRLHSYRLYFVA